MDKLVKAVLIVVALVVALLGIAHVPGPPTLIVLLTVMMYALALVALVLVFQNKL